MKENFKDWFTLYKYVWYKKPLFSFIVFQQKPVSSSACRWKYLVQVATGEKNEDFDSWLDFHHLAVSTSEYMVAVSV